MPRKSVKAGRIGPVVGVLGLGYMGLASAAAFAQHGAMVIGYDVVPERRAIVRAGSSPFHEEGLGELVRSTTDAGRLTVVETVREVATVADVIFLCLPTPPLPDGRIDLRAIQAGAKTLGAEIGKVDDFRLVVVKSTVVPGTTEGVIGPALRTAAGKGSDQLAVASNPEFLAEGTMVRDALRPDRIVVGVEDARSAELLQQVYAAFDSPVIVMTPAGAEMTKYAANAFLAMKISFANEVSRYCEAVGVNVDDVARGIGSDPRIGAKFLHAGPGFGGSCFSKDVSALVRSASDRGIRLPLSERVVPANDEQTSHAVELAVRQLPNPSESTVAVLGLSFKEGTDDLRESRALPIVRGLAARGVQVRAHDPAAMAGFRAWLAAEPEAVRSRVSAWDSPAEAIANADVAVLQVPWPEYLDWPNDWTGRMRRPVLVDLRRAFPPARAAEVKLQLVRLGDGRRFAAPSGAAPSPPTKGKTTGGPVRNKPRR